jgi:hypothetical protein
MGRSSSIKRLDPDIVDECNRLIRAGRTNDEIVEALRGLGAQVSRSAVGRYKQNALQAMEKYKEAQEIAKVWVDRLEAEPSGDVARLLPEMLRTIAFQTLSQMSDQETGVDSQSIMFLARALKDVGSASKTNVDIELVLRNLRAKAAAAAESISKQVKSAGLSDEVADQIRAKILGITVDAKPA